MTGADPRGSRVVRALALGSVACMLTCGPGIQQDATAEAAKLAGPDATDCGFYDGHSPDADRGQALRACMAAALLEQRPFFAAVTPASADGGTVTAYASDGARTYRVVHDYVLAMGLLGCDSESLARAECGRLEDRGNQCGSLEQDLCWSCESPRPYPDRP